MAIVPVRHNNRSSPVWYKTRITLLTTGQHFQIWFSQHNYSPHPYSAHSLPPCFNYHLVSEFLYSWSCSFLPWRTSEERHCFARKGNHPIPQVKWVSGAGIKQWKTGINNRSVSDCRIQDAKVTSCYPEMLRGSFVLPGGRCLLGPFGKYSHLDIETRLWGGRKQGPFDDRMEAVRCEQLQRLCQVMVVVVVGGCFGGKEGQRQSTNGPTSKASNLHFHFTPLQFMQHSAMQEEGQIRNPLVSHKEGSCGAYYQLITAGMSKQPTGAPIHQGFLSNQDDDWWMKALIVGD